MDIYTKVGTGTRLACAPLSFPDWMKVGSQTPFSQSGIDLDLSGSQEDGWPQPPPKINRVDFTPNPILGFIINLSPATTVYASDGTSYPVTTVRLFNLRTGLGLNQILSTFYSKSIERTANELFYH
ncbi:unnamed protein product [Phytophthora fragariaefolia]|uniref:Unnamed protein product n=1 Tax=Phytophthora fragariaefolia TaxID=1490495 RepID=A0A9W6WYP0_9STRA|nr:unnamed protein product [Phytophthora fragariaefolia]